VASRKNAIFQRKDSGGGRRKGDQRSTSPRLEKERVGSRKRTVAGGGTPLFGKRKEEEFQGGRREKIGNGTENKSKRPSSCAGSKPTRDKPNWHPNTKRGGTSHANTAIHYEPNERTHPRSQNSRSRRTSVAHYWTIGAERGAAH